MCFCFLPDNESDYIDDLLDTDIPTRWFVRGRERFRRELNLEKILEKALDDNNIIEVDSDDLQKELREE